MCCRSPVPVLGSILELNNQARLVRIIWLNLEYPLSTDDFLCWRNYRQWNLAVDI